MQIHINDDPDQPTIIDFPRQWLRIAYGVGQIQITPNSAAISTFVVGNAGNLPRVFGARDYFPQMIKINYTAGFEKDKIPMIISHWVGLKAAIQLLRIAGDIIFGAGVMNTSIGLGGLSQSIGTTKGNGGAFSGRISGYEADLEKLSRKIKRFYKSIKLTTV